MMDPLSEYAAKWDRDPENNFAVDLYRRLQRGETGARHIEDEITRRPLRHELYAGWGISEEEARDALSTLLLSTGNR